MRLGLGLGIVKSAASIYKGILDKFPNAVAAYSTRKLKTSYPTTLPADYGAAAAYSLRKVKSDYEGSAVRVRKAVSLVSEETDIGFDANGNLDTATLLSFASDADNGDVFVSIWYDQSGNGNGNNATNTTASDQPKIVSTGSLLVDSAGFPVITPSGTDHLIIDNAGINIASNSLIYTVFSYNDSADNVVFSTVQSTDYDNCVSIGNNFNGTNSGVISVRLGGVTGTRGAFEESRSGYSNGDRVITNTLAANLFSNSESLFNNTSANGNIGHRANVSTPGTFIFRAVNYYGSSPTNEIILYTASDQSTNRKDIEWNINNHYSIYEQWDRKSCMNVRRSSDNATQDIGFSGKNINQTQLESFVNDASPVLDDYTGAAAAYSLRKVRTAYGGSAIRVRRSSDDTEQDIGFDANGDLDTTALTTFVNADVDIYTSDFSVTEDLGEFNGTGAAAQSVGGVNDAYKFTLSGGNVQHTVFTDTGNTLESGKSFTIVFDYYIPSGQTLSSIVFDNFGGSGAISGSLNVTDNWTTETINFTADGSRPRWWAGAFGTNVNADGDVFYLKNIVVTQTTADGAVTTFYDQSGNGNHATNATSTEQPLVVSGGTLVEENGKAAIDFDGVDDQLENATFTLTQPYTYFGVYKTTAANGIVFRSNNPLVFAGEYAGNNNSIYAGVYLGDSSFNLAIQQLQYGLYNGVSSETDANNLGTISGDAGLRNLSGLTIGSAANFGNYLNGTIQEVIFFDSDQSSNRLSIEGNIGRYYNITGYRDGFVTKWYDQSGEYNHAENSTHDEQPQIVRDGSMLKEKGKAAIDFDGVDDEIGFLADISATEVSSVIVAKAITYAINNRFFGWRNSTHSFLSVLSQGGNSTTLRGISQTSVSSQYLQYTGVDYTNQSLISMYNASVWRINGNEFTTAVTASTTGVRTTNGLTLGSRGNGSNTGNIRFQEAIFFTSDQSGNREDIEKNINTHFKIYS